jgi:diguanylate cyclase (GGDEF)-like protein
MDPLLTMSVAATSGAVVTAWPVIAVLRRTRRNLHRALRALDHDDLTGLASRRAFLAYFDAVRRTGRAAVVLVDLDRFKQVNDRYGHHAGDDVLRQVADRMRMLGSEVWLAARLAGDEFVLVVDPDRAAAVTGRIRSAIGGTPFTVGDQRCSVTASAGFAVALGPGDQDVLRQADWSMYQDKAVGRGALAGGFRMPTRERPVEARRQNRAQRRAAGNQVLPVPTQQAGDRDEAREDAAHPGSPRASAPVNVVSA